MPLFYYVCSTDCMHVALENLLFEITVVRDGVLSLPTCFRVILEAIFYLVFVFSAGLYSFHCSYCVSFCRELRVRFYNK